MGNKGIINVGAKGNKKIFTANLEKIPTLANFMQDFASNVLELDEPLPITMFADSRLIEKEEMDELDELLQQLSKEDKAK